MGFCLPKLPFAQGGNLKGRVKVIFFDEEVQ